MLFTVAAKQFMSILNQIVKVEALATTSPRSSTTRSSTSKMWNFLMFTTTVAVSSVLTFATMRYLDRRSTERKSLKTKQEEVARQKLEARKPEHIWNTVLFFEDGERNNPELATIKTFVHYLESARATLQLCLYRFSHSGLGDILLKKFNYRRGLLVQIITDYDVYTSVDKGTTRMLRKCVEHGVSLKVKRSKSHMHHKFIIIDGEAVLTGSLNWTEQAFTANHEDVLVTTNPLHVNRYIQRFNTIWRQAQDPPSGL